MATLTPERTAEQDLAFGENGKESSTVRVHRQVICLSMMIGRCRECSEDYDITHHPNNYDCPDYKPTALHVFTVEE